MDVEQSGSARIAPASIRPATEADAVAINDIYNYYVQNSTSTYQEELEPIESRRRWLSNHGAAHPVIVAEQGSCILGWAALSPFHARSAYRRTVEDSVYVHHEHRRKGIGSMLLQHLIVRARVVGHHAIIGLIDAAQVPSIALHARFGFREMGRLEEVGFKFGTFLNVVYMELLLNS